MEFHDDIEVIELEAFSGCCSLRSVKLLGVKIVRASVFKNCTGLTDVEFGNELGWKQSNCTHSIIAAH